MGWLKKNWDKARGKHRDRNRSTQQQWDAAGERPDELGFYKGLPDGGIGPQAQYLSERAVAQYNERQRRAARDVLRSYGNATQSYRHGGAYALQSGIAQGLANVHMGSQVGAPDNLYNTREDRMKEARKDQRNAGYLQAAISLGSSALGAAMGGMSGGSAPLAAMNAATNAGSQVQQGNGGGDPGQAQMSSRPGSSQYRNSMQAPGGVSIRSPGQPSGPGALSEGPGAGNQAGPTGQQEGGGGASLGMSMHDPGFGSPAMSTQVQGVVQQIAQDLGVPPWHVFHMVAKHDPSILDDSVIDAQEQRLVRLIMEDSFRG